MTDIPLGLGFAAGIFAAINPCGFAMLPAYLSFFLGREALEPDASSSVARAVVVALATSAGFALVFGLVGAAVRIFSWSVQAWLPWVTSVLGAVLVVLGLMMLAGRQLTVPLPRPRRAAEGRSVWSMFLFGVSYAVASLSCTLPVFVATVSAATSREGAAGGIAVFLAYAAGMATVLTALTVALALARHGVVLRMRRALPYVNRVAGGLLVLAGAWFTYYGWYQRQDLTRPTWTHWLATAATDVNDRLRAWVDGFGAGSVGVIALGLVGAASILVFGLRRRAPVPAPGAGPEPTPTGGGADRPATR